MEKLVVRSLDLHVLTRSENIAEMSAEIFVGVPKNHKAGAPAFEVAGLPWLGFDLFLLSGTIDKAPTQILGRIL